MRAAVFLFAFLTAVPALADELPPGPFSEKTCIQCHEKETPELVSGWRAGSHVDGCISCHGEMHPGAAAKARRSQTCIVCHGGPKAALSRSYLTSKHGVIATIEQGRWDFSQSLADANYRAPTCAYCHFHGGAHGVEAGEKVRDSCLDCHSPRLVSTLLASGERGLDIGRLKVREAEEAVRGARLSADEAAELNRGIDDMRQGPLASLGHGVNHHSPDYQWWYGQAALDGALLRIKAKLTEILRRRALEP